MNSQMKNLGLLLIALNFYFTKSIGTDFFGEPSFKQIVGGKFPFWHEYDFIVIGAGPGGATVANRLSENPNWQVLLLEAGPEESEVFKIPIFSYSSYGTYLDWGYKTEPQKNACLGLKKQRCTWPRGKELGGSTSINGMAYTRGYPDDYDEWSLMGNKGWSYKEIFPYFLKSEKASHEFLALRDDNFNPYHSRMGYLSVEPLTYIFKLGYAMFSALMELNIFPIDYNNGSPAQGFGIMQLMERHGFRCSAAEAFLEPVRFRKNLHVSTNSLVTKILINPVTKAAFGVRVYKDSNMFTIFAKKEVILSAGALESPHLLMLSGVGPQEHLEELGIPVIKDLPVGKYLQEHVAFNGIMFTVNKTNVGAKQSLFVNPYNYVKLYVNGKGPLTNCLVDGLAFISTKYNNDRRPDVELILRSGSFLLGSGTNGISDEIYDTVYRPYKGREVWTVHPALLRPKSTGYMKLKSSNPWDHPLFYPNYLTEEEDLNRLVESIKFIIAMSETAAMQEYGSKMIDTALPGCEEFSFGSDNYWKCALKMLTVPMNHQTGTCKMGLKTDPTAVVSPELKVHGIKNLRVVDSSVIPKLPSCHLTAPTFMIGEKGSDLIKETWEGKDFFSL